MNWQRILHWIPALAAVAAIYMVGREISQYQLTWESAKQIIQDFQWQQLLAALAFSGLGYLCLGAYDLLAVRTLGYSISWRQALYVGFLSYAVSNNAGQAMLSGGSIRFRFYSEWGLNPAAIGKIILFGSSTYLLGALSLFCASAILLTAKEFTDPQLVGGHLRWLVCIAALGLAGYWLLVLFKRNVSLGRMEFSLPNYKTSLLQTLLGAVDLILASLVLYSLLDSTLNMSFFWFFTLYLLAQMSGLFSQVPGGLGVFEGIFLYLVGPVADHQQLLMALVSYRVIYYFMPLSLAGVSFAWIQNRQWFAKLLNNPFASRTAKITQISARLLRDALPRVLPGLMIMAGAVLLISGSTPALPERLQPLAKLVGLPLIEISHLLGSLIGLLLLLVARAVALRIRLAYPLTLILLSAGIFFSLFKGWDYEEASFLGLVLIFIASNRRYFYRPSFFEQRLLTWPWVFMLLSLVSLSVFVGFIAHQDVDYSNQLWWEFSLHGSASRFLRTSLALSILSSALVIYFLLSRGRYRPAPPSTEEINQAASLIAQQPNTEQIICLTGDKYIFWSETRTSFIAYTTSNRYWIALGDPCGNRDNFPGLMRAFRAAADLYGAKPVFYRVSSQYLSHYVDLGLNLAKLGEEALVDLEHFSIKGNAGMSFRGTLNKINKDGYEFALIPRAQVSEFIAQLKLISDHWLAHKKVREKSFSLGFFDEHYLSQTDLAVVRKDDQLVAFANLLRTEKSSEISIDLMRYDDSAPKGTMDYLLINLMLWGQAQGYSNFNLGMAPLSGLDRDRLAPLWQRLGASLFQLDNDFYDFQGLRQYKEKFHPQWRPSYLAYPAGQNIAKVIFTITQKISGGLRGSFGK